MSQEQRAHISTQLCDPDNGFPSPAPLRSDEISSSGALHQITTGMVTGGRGIKHNLKRVGAEDGGMCKIIRGKIMWLEPDNICISGSIC